MLKTKDILDEKEKILRKISKEVSFPLKEEDKKIISDMIEYLKNSQTPSIAKKYKLRPGMGLSAVQLGFLKRMFVCVYEKEDGSFDEYIIINPEMISHSEEIIYVEEGEGCLSINREVEGIVPRYARCSFKGQNLEGEEIIYRLREEVSIVFQHELDHLNGILFPDRIDKNNPYKDYKKYRAL